MGETLYSLYQLTWKEYSLKCQGLIMKYQRLSVLTRQIAAVIINTTPGMDEPVKPTEIFITAFDDIEPGEVPMVTVPDQWAEKKQVYLKIFEKLKNGKS